MREDPAHAERFVTGLLDDGFGVTTGVVTALDQNGAGAYPQ